MELRVNVRKFWGGVGNLRDEVATFEPPLPVRIRGGNSTAT